MQKKEWGILMKIVPGQLQDLLMGHARPSA